MTTYRLFPSTNGPSTPTTFGSGTYGSGNFISGVLFAVSGGGNWFNGYWWWVCPTAQNPAGVKCALWSATSLNTGVLVPGSVVTSGALTAGQWNYIPLATPIQLAPSYDPNLSTNGSAYIAAIGCNGNFPDTNNFWGTGGAGINGIINGTLVAYSGTAAHGGTLVAPYTLPQGVFSTGGSDPSTTMPNSQSNIDNFWVDVSISTSAPAGYSGTYRLWPSKSDDNNVSGSDSAVNYVIATEIAIGGSVTVNKVWYYSPPGATQLATRVDVWSTTSQTQVLTNSSPSWSGAAGSGWISTTLAGTLPAGEYRVSVYNAAASPTTWGAKDAASGYWDIGVGANGINWGIISAPNLSNSSAAINFNTNANVAHGQPTFSQTDPPYSTQGGYPILYAPVTANTDPSNAIHTQNYWVDLEVTPNPVSVTGVVAANTVAAVAGTVAESMSVPAAANTARAMAGSILVSLIGSLSTSLVSAPLGSVNVSATATTNVVVTAIPGMVFKTPPPAFKWRGIIQKTSLHGRLFS